MGRLAPIKSERTLKLNKASNKSESHSNKNKNNNKAKKLSFNEQNELDNMEQNIKNEEELLKEYSLQTQDPENSNKSSKLKELAALIETTQEKIDHLYARWEELESKK